LRRRESFDAVAELYDLARPPYPTALIEDLVRSCRLRRGSRVLEIGAGSGQLTVPLAAGGAVVTAVELGPNLAALARRHLSEFDNARVLVADFDAWNPVPGSFDLVVAATAFHWLDEKSRVSKSVEALRQGGRLAVIQTHWGVGDEGDAFAEASQACYRRWDPEHDTAYQPTRLEDLPERLDEVADTGQFRAVEHTRYSVRRCYTARAYLDLLSSFSNVIGLDDDHRRGFLCCMKRLIQEQFGGQVMRLDVYDVWIGELS
jgi:SAM-dependent methyltransferase